jgi:hypothetical protein
VDEVAVLAGEAHGLAARLVDERHDVLVDEPAQDHLDHVERLLVGDAHALDELALLAELLQELPDLRARAVHHHGVHADQLEQHHVLGEVLLQRNVGHRVAAVLDDDGTVVETLDVGQGLDEDLGLLRGR